MTLLHLPRTPREEAYAARARSARGWAGLCLVVLVAFAGTAIWQEPRLWPAGHAALVGTSETIAQALEGNDTVRGFFETLTGERAASNERTGYADKLAGFFTR